MSAEKAQALVLYVVDWSETSNVVTLFSREFGKVRALAKGGRRPKGPFESALDLLSVCRIVFLRKSSTALDLLTEAKLERRFRPRRHDLSSLYAGYYVAELLSELTDDYDAHPALFDLAAATLQGLAGDGSVAAWLLRFELLALAELGHLPQLSACVECGTPLHAPDRVSFGLVDGGLLCTTCRPGKSQVVSLRAAVLEQLKRFADRDCPDWLEHPPDARLSGELRGVMSHYLAHLMGHKSALQPYLRNIT